MSEKESPKIRDIAKFKKMREEMKAFKMVKRILPFASPILKIFGVDTKQMKEAFADFDKLEKEFLKLSELPDKFNDNFSSKGFIVFDFLNPDVVSEALRIAEIDIDEAEKYLVNHFTPETVETYLYMMHGVKAFRSRMELAEKALLDYKEQRYHACIPVVLALMDGLVNELNPQNVGIAADKVDLRAWDCITSHEKGLNALKKVLFRSRTTTQTEEITVPYRHGILHGMDLGYANKTVAAKTWATLFAVRDWAIKVEGKELTEPPPKPKTSWSEILQKLQKNKIQKEMLEEWKPRDITIGKDIPKNGEIEDFPQETAERRLVEFFYYWQEKNYGYMSKCILSFLRTPENEIAKRVREVYQSCFLKQYELLEVIDEAPSVTEILVSLIYEQNKNLTEKEVKIRFVNEDLNGTPSVRGMPDTNWGIVNWDVV
jgi:hypothetical protein